MHLEKTCHEIGAHCTMLDPRLGVASALSTRALLQAVFENARRHDQWVSHRVSNRQPWQRVGALASARPSMRRALTILLIL